MSNWEYITTKYQTNYGYILPIRIPAQFITKQNPELKGEVVSQEKVKWESRGRKHGWYARGIYLAEDTWIEDGGERYRKIRYQFYPILTPDAAKSSIYRQLQFTLDGQEWRISGRHPERFRGGLKAYQKFCAPLIAKGIPVDCKMT